MLSSGTKEYSGLLSQVVRQFEVQGNVFVEFLATDRNFLHEFRKLNHKN
jgi:hypothetical protein